MRQPRYRTGAEGRINHLKRGYGIRRSRLKNHHEDADLDRMGDPRLRPRHPRRPGRLTLERLDSTRAPSIDETAARTAQARPFQSPVIRGK
jgi:hypothetical protein